MLSGSDPSLDESFYLDRSTQTRVRPLVRPIDKRGSKWTHRRPRQSRTRLPSSLRFMATWVPALTRSDDAPLC